MLLRQRAIEILKAWWKEMILEQLNDLWNRNPNAQWRDPCARNYLSTNPSPKAVPDNVHCFVCNFSAIATLTFFDTDSTSLFDGDGLYTNLYSMNSHSRWERAAYAKLYNHHPSWWLMSWELLEMMVLLLVMLIIDCVVIFSFVKSFLNVLRTNLVVR